MQPFKCPSCAGTGKVSRPPWIAGDQPFWGSSSTGDLYDCRACAGSGIVWGPPTLPISVPTVFGPACLHEYVPTTGGDVCRKCGGNKLQFTVSIGPSTDLRGIHS